MSGEDVFAKVTIDAIRSGRQSSDPFAHRVVRDVFPAYLYESMLAGLPREVMPIGHARRNLERYENRYIADLVGAGPLWRHIAGWMMSHDFAVAVVKAMGLDDDVDRVGRSEALLIRDDSGFAIGPHTDAPNKLLTALFYLAADESRPELGTALYARPGFECQTGEHYDFDGFTETGRVRYVSNSALIFKRTTTSFHGRPAIETPAPRWLIAYSIRLSGG